MSRSDTSLADPLGSLYQHHHGWLRGWLQRKLGNRQDAEDLAQDTFVRVLGVRYRQGSLTGEPRALLTHIAKGLVIDHWRRQEVARAYQDVVSSLPPGCAPSLESCYLIQEALFRVESMLASLPAVTRQIFLLAQLEGLTLKQIAERESMPVITVRRHIQRAMVACMLSLED